MPGPVMTRSCWKVGLGALPFWAPLFPSGVPLTPVAGWRIGWGGGSCLVVGPAGLAVVGRGWGGDCDGYSLSPLLSLPLLVFFRCSHVLTAPWCFTSYLSASRMTPFWPRVLALTVL